MFALVLAALTSLGSQSATIPFTYFDNRIVIQCSIDGKGPFAMIVDTGSPDVVVTPETAQRLQAKVRSAGTVTGAGNNPVAQGSTHLLRLSLGALSFTNVDADVLNLDQIRAKLHFPHLDGLIGHSVLKRYAVFINVDAGTLTLSTSPPSEPATASITPFHGVLPVIRATIDNIPTTVIVDTGDRSSLTLFGPFAKRYAFYRKYPSKENVLTGYGLGGPVYGDVFAIPTITVLGRTLDGVITRASRQTGGVFTGSDQGGGIGSGILKRFNIVFDYPRGVIIAWPSKFFSTPDAFRPPG